MAVVSPCVAACCDRGSPGRSSKFKQAQFNNNKRQNERGGSNGVQGDEAVVCGRVVKMKKTGACVMHSRFASSHVTGNYCIAIRLCAAT